MGSWKCLLMLQCAFSNEGIVLLLLVLLLLLSLLLLRLLQKSSLSSSTILMLILLIIFSLLLLLYITFSLPVSYHTRYFPDILQWCGSGRYFLVLYEYADPSKKNTLILWYLYKWETALFYMSFSERMRAMLIDILGII